MGLLRGCLFIHCLLLFSGREYIKDLHNTISVLFNCLLRQSGWVLNISCGLIVPHFSVLSSGIVFVLFCLFSLVICFPPQWLLAVSLLHFVQFRMACYCVLTYF